MDLVPICHDNKFRNFIRRLNRGVFQPEFSNLVLKNDLWSIFKVKRFFCNVVIYYPKGPKET